MEAALSEPIIARQIIVAMPPSNPWPMSGQPLCYLARNLGRYSNGSDRPHYLETWAAAGVTINKKSRSGPLHLRPFPVRIVGTVQPDRLVEALAGADVGMAARFLHVWPDTPVYRYIGLSSIAALSMMKAPWQG